jgi:hypothetical protein
MAMADRDGCVWAAIPGISDRARVPLDATRKAIEKFMQPDFDSRSENDDGKRLEKIDRGFRLINLSALKERCRLEAERERKRRWAAKHRAEEATDASTKSLRKSTVDESSAAKQSKAKHIKEDLPSRSTRKRPRVPKPEDRQPTLGLDMGVGPDIPDTHPTIQVTRHYEAEFLRTRGTAVDFGKKWSRASASFKTLQETYGVEQSNKIISNALSTVFCKRMMPWELVDDAMKWVGDNGKKTEPETGTQINPSEVW